MADSAVSPAAALMPFAADATWPAASLTARFRGISGAAKYGLRFVGHCACGGCYRTAKLFGAVARAGEPVFKIGAHGTGQVRHFLGALVDHVIDLRFNFFGGLLAAFAGQEQSGADQQQGRRDRAEQAPHRVGDRRTDRCHLQRIVLGPALDRLHHAFSLFAHVIPDFFFDMRGRDEGFDFGCGIADRVAQFAHGGGQRVAGPFGFFAQLFDGEFSCGWHRLIFPAQQKCRGTGIRFEEPVCSYARSKVQQFISSTCQKTVRAALHARAYGSNCNAVTSRDCGFRVDL